MFFSLLRKQMRWVLIALAVMFGGSLLYIGGPGIFGRTDPGQEVLARPVAEVEGYTISQAELQSAYRSNIAAYQQLFGQVSRTQAEAIMYQSLDGIIRSRLLLEQAKAKGIQVPASDIDAELEQIKNNFPTEADYRRRLREARISERELRDMIRDSLLVRRMEEQVRAEVEVTEEELADAYRQVRARHILIRPEGPQSSWDEAAWEKARERAVSLRAQLEAGADFAELARQHSDDASSRESGGDVGFVRKDSPFVEPFKEAALALQVGEISEPVRTEFGYHLIQVTERRDPEGEEFEKARPQLMEQLRLRKGEARLQEWLEEVRAQADVVIHDPRLRAYGRAREGDLEGAVADYRAALEEDPFEPYLHVSLSEVLQALGRTDEALKELEAAVEKDPSDPQLKLALGVAYWEAERGDDAARLLTEAAEQADWDPNVQFTAARILAELGYEEEARQAEQRLEDILRSWQSSQSEDELGEEVEQLPDSGQAQEPDGAEGEEPAEEAVP